MKDPNQSLIEVIHHIYNSHPEIRRNIEMLVFQGLNLDLNDVNILFTLNAKNLLNSKAQLRQDLFVLHHLKFQRNGFFVEFGATNGLDLSNTFLLESEYGWNGILAEPAKIWHNELYKNRKCFIDDNCVWSESNMSLTFNETKEPELGTINSFSSNDNHAQARNDGKLYQVNTISLIDLLIKYNAPSNIDYLSIDTEGSEFNILKNFDFDKYSFNVITCEHNYSPMRDELFKLLSNKGYIRVFENLSLFDDWYIKS